MNVRYRVTLSEEERTALEEMLGKGRSQVREVSVVTRVDGPIFT